MQYSIKYVNDKDFSELNIEEFYLLQAVIR